MIPFGSATTGMTTAASDVDILIVSPKIPRAAIKQARLKAAIEELAGLPAINTVEIHLATPLEAANNPIYSEVLHSSKNKKKS